MTRCNVLLYNPFDQTSHTIVDHKVSDDRLHIFERYSWKTYFLLYYTQHIPLSGQH